jgi:hypothetical protein
MPTPVRKVFLSSTGADLRTYREAAYTRVAQTGRLALRPHGGFPSARLGCGHLLPQQGEGMRPVHRHYRAPLRRRTQGTKQSYTQREYQAAVEAKLPRLLFLAPDDFPVPANLREPEWKLERSRRLSSDPVLDSKDRILSIGFTSPDRSDHQIVTAIRNWERETSGTHGADPTAYLQALWEDTRFIAIRGLRVGNESAHQLRYRPAIHAADHGARGLPNARKGRASASRSRCRRRSKTRA